MGSPDITVVVPCYNEGRYLGQALSSLRRNDTCRLEVLVVNDGSTDGSLPLMRSFEEADPRFRVIDKGNEGYGATVNRGLSEARGTYVTVFEPDDYVLPHMYDRLLAEAARQGMPDVVKSSFWRVVGAGTAEEHLEQCGYHDGVFARRQPFTVFDDPTLLRHHPSIWSAIYRRDFLVARGIRLMEVPGAGWVDNPFMMEALVQARSIVYLNESYYCYREALPGSSSELRLSTIPFERWHDMADVLERLHVTDGGVWDALYARVFDSLCRQVALGALGEEPYRSAVGGVCERMDPARVRRLPWVSPRRKLVYYEVRGIEPPGGLLATYLRSQAADYARTLRLYGPAALAGRVGGVVRRAVGA